MPYSYKYLKTIGSASNTKEDLSIADVNTGLMVLPKSTTAQAARGSDSLSINPKNAWIQTKLSSSESNGNTVLEIAHAVPKEIPVTTPPPLTFSNSNNSFVVTNDLCDNAGHIYNRTTSTYQLGNNFSQIGVLNPTAENAANIEYIEPTHRTLLFRLYPQK